jgi:hypothetical protein
MADRLFDRGGLRDQVREGETPSRSHPREDVTPRRCFPQGVTSDRTPAGGAHAAGAVSPLERPTSTPQIKSHLHIPISET